MEVASSPCPQAGSSKISHSTPDYLTSGSSLIKALKASSDPPQPGWPSKIEIAQLAWTTGVDIPRKADVIRDWILESWGRTKPSSTNRNHLIDPEYHHLFARVYPFSTQPPSTHLTLLISLLQSIKNSPSWSSNLLSAVQKSFDILFPCNESTYKADAWVNVWVELLRIAASSGIVGKGHMLRGLVQGVRDRLQASLVGSQNEKKIAQNLAEALPVISQAFRAQPDLQAIINSLTPALLPLSILETIDPLKPILSTLSAQSDHLSTLSFLPYLFGASINAMQKNRFPLFSRGASINQPLDVIVAEKLRAAVISNLGLVLGVISHIQDKLMSAPSSTDGAINVLEAVWASRQGVWEQLQGWGGYLETDEASGRLVAVESQLATGTLSTYGGSEPTTVGTEGLAGHLLRTLRVLEDLDHNRTNIGTDVVGWCLASPPRTSVPAHALLGSLLNYYIQTRSINSFFSLLSESIQTLFDSSLSEDVIKTLYSLVRTGLIDYEPKLGQAIRQLDGGRLGDSWVTIVNDLCDSMSKYLLPPAFQRQEGIKMASAAIVELLSLLADSLFSAAPSMNRLVGARIISAAEAAIERSIKLMDNLSLAKDFSFSVQTKSKKRKWMNGTVSTISNEALDIALIAKARLTHRGNLDYGLSPYNLDPAQVAEAMVDPSRLPQLRIELFNIAIGRLSSDSTLSVLTEPILEVLSAKIPVSPLGHSSKGSGTSLDTLAWSLIAKQGLIVFEQVADEHLDHLISLLASYLRSKDNAIIVNILQNALNWELPRFRGALFNYLEKHVEKDSASVYRILIHMPSSSIFKQWKLIGAACALDKTADHSTRIILRKWLAKQAENQNLGPLGYEPLALRSIISITEKEGLQDQELIDVTLELLKNVFSYANANVERDSNIIEGFVEDVIQKGTLLRFGDNQLDSMDKNFGLRSVIILFESVMKRKSQTYPASLMSRFETLAQTFKTTLEPLVLKQLDANVAEPIALFQYWRTCVRFCQWTSPTTIQHLPLNATLGLISFDLVAIEASEETELVLATYIIVLAASQDLWNLRRGFREKLDNSFVRYLQKQPVEKFETILRSAIGFAKETNEERRIETTLHAIQVMLRTSANGTGRAISNVMPDLLVALDQIVQSGNPNAMSACHSLLTSTVVERAGVFKSADIHRIITILQASFAPAARRLRVSQTDYELVSSPLSLFSALLRQRPELVVETLAPFVGLISVIIPSFQRPRHLRLTKTTREKILARLPIWIAENDLFPSPFSKRNEATRTEAGVAEEKNLPEVAGRLSRLLINLSTARYTPLHSTDSTDFPSISRAEPRPVSGPLAKHAPAILVAYARAASSPTLGLSTGVRKALEPGLFALCDVITAGGRAGSRGREGEGVGLPFGLGEGEGGGAEMEVWADLWKSWSRKRYTGQG